MAARFRIGIDLGGTKIEAVAVDRLGAVCFRQRLATPIGNYRATIEAITALARVIERRIGETASIGIGIPGTISPMTGLVKNANSTWLIGRPLQRDLEAVLGRPIRLANDANCFVLSEATDGAAMGMETVFGVILGTGVGGGIALAGRVLRGANSITGEWGHNPLRWPASGEIPGPACYCGRSGCVETFLSGPALAADHRRHGGQSLSAVEIADFAVRGDAECGATLARYMDRLARGLASVINLIDPDAIVLGGGLSGISALYERGFLGCGGNTSSRIRSSLNCFLPSMVIRAECGAPHGCGAPRRKRDPVVLRSRHLRHLCHAARAVRHLRLTASKSRLRSPPKPGRHPFPADRGSGGCPRRGFCGRSGDSVRARTRPVMTAEASNGSNSHHARQLIGRARPWQAERRQSVTPHDVSARWKEATRRAVEKAVSSSV